MMTGDSGTEPASFDQLFSSHSWRPIRNCPGRYVLQGGLSTVSVSDLIESALDPEEYRSSAAPDPVIVAEIPDGGIISYRRPNGAYVHTLNTPDGFARKLLQLNISLPLPS